MNGIEITTERLLLRPLGTQDLSTVNDYALNYENTKYMFCLPNQNSGETLAFLQNVELEWAKEHPDFFEFAILYEHKQIGAVSLYLELDVGELGWILNRKYWGRGFAFEAAKAVMEYFCQNHGIRHFAAHCDTENIVSYKTMEKLGMTRMAEYGGRRNRGASKDSFEYLYELRIP